MTGEARIVADRGGWFQGLCCHRSSPKREQTLGSAGIVARIAIAPVSHAGFIAIVAKQGGTVSHVICFARQTDGRAAGETLQVPLRCYESSARQQKTAAICAFLWSMSVAIQSLQCCYYRNRHLFSR